MRIEDSSHDIPQPVHIGVLDGIHAEEVVLHECDAAVCKRLGVLLWPDGVLALFEDWAPVLDNKFQFGVKSAELDVESSYAPISPEWFCFCLLGILDAPTPPPTSTIVASPS